jgi:hypothetical protein
MDKKLRFSAFLMGVALWQRRRQGKHLGGMSRGDWHLMARREFRQQTVFVCS